MIKNKKNKKSLSLYILSIAGDSYMRQMERSTLGHAV